MKHDFIGSMQKLNNIMYRKRENIGSSVFRVTVILETLTVMYILDQQETYLTIGFRFTE